MKNIYKLVFIDLFLMIFVFMVFYIGLPIIFQVDALFYAVMAAIVFEAIKSFSNLQIKILRRLKPIQYLRIKIKIWYYQRKRKSRKMNEGMVDKSFKKLQSDNEDEKFVGLREISYWALEEDIDKPRIIEKLLLAASNEKDLYFRNNILKILCNDYGGFIR